MANVHNTSVNRILKILEEIKSEAKQRYKAEIKGIFGSYVRGEEDRSSDIDVLVEFDEDANLIDFVGLSLFLEEKLKRPVDVVPQSAIREEIKEDILSEAVYL